LLPADAEKDFAAFGIEFCQATDLARRAITLLRWSQSTLGETRQAIHKVVTASGDGDTRSLLGALSVGKAAAAAVEPLKDVQRELRSASGKREDITCKETEHAVLEELADPLNALKAAKKYAESEVARVFTDIRDDTISNWKTMYRDTTSGLSPARLVVGSGHDKSVTAFLSKGEYEVPEKFFGNAGLQRAVALSFYFALLEKHPRDHGRSRSFARRWPSRTMVTRDPETLDETHSVHRCDTSRAVLVELPKRLSCWKCVRAKRATLDAPRQLEARNPFETCRRGSRIVA
jgi:hypothetical protein